MILTNIKITILVFTLLFLGACETTYPSKISYSNQSTKQIPSSEIQKIEDICNDRLGTRKIISWKHEKQCLGDHGTDPLDLPFPKKSDLPPCNTKKHPYTWDKCFAHAKSFFKEYEGEFVNGKREGVGRYKGVGKVYIGNWRNNLPDGVGVLKILGYANKITNDQIIIKGRWENGTLMEVYLQNFDFSSKINYLIEQKEYKFFSDDTEESLFNLGLNFAYKDIQCIGDEPDQWSFCKKEINFTNGEKYSGEWKHGKFDGLGTYYYQDGSTFEGEWKSGKKDGTGYYTSPQLSKHSQYWDFGVQINYEKYKEKISRHIKKYEPNTLIQKNENKLNLSVKHTSPKEDGSFFLKIENIRNLASLKINDEVLPIPKENLLELKKFAKAGQETVFTIIATDTNGNSDTKTITVNRPIAESQTNFSALNPSQVKKQPTRDAVAVIIGIADYKNLPRADFANDDASVFYDYAIRALGIKPENIKLLVDGNADDVAIYQTFKSWLPSRVRPTTDVYVFYSGHGLPGADGQGLYLLPQRAHRDLIEKTAISQSEINSFIQSAKPRSVTIFLDSCYSGVARSGETLLSGARPVVLKSNKKLFPDDFTVITASQADQISSSSPDLKHGIFSYYLMRGMEGEADSDKDGRITVGEMHRYLTEQVARQAGMMNRRQEPQIVGDLDRILVGN